MNEHKAISLRLKELDRESKVRIERLVAVERKRLHETINPYHISHEDRTALKEALETLAACDVAPHKQHGKDADMRKTALEVIHRVQPVAEARAAWTIAKNWEKLPVDAVPVPDHLYFAASPDGVLFNLQNGKPIAVSKDDKVNVRHHSKISVAKIIAQSFLPNPLNRKSIELIDGNPKNLAVSNLRWKDPMHETRPARPSRANPCAAARAKARRDAIKAHDADIKRQLRAAKAA